MTDKKAKAEAARRWGVHAGAYNQTPRWVPRKDGKGYKAEGMEDHIVEDQSGRGRAKYYVSCNHIYELGWEDNRPCELHRGWGNTWEEAFEDAAQKEKKA